MINNIVVLVFYVGLELCSICVYLKNSIINLTLVDLVHITINVQRVYEFS